LLQPDHPRFQEFAELSAAEELAGLYVNTAVIGFRINWERLLAAGGLIIQGHNLVRQTEVPAATSAEICREIDVAVDRHKTALTRYQLSRPVKTLIEYAQLTAGCSILDYGCGRGADIRGLRELGFDASGWDPIHAPEGSRHEADVVNLGYVLNVIEDPAERLETLTSAWSLTKRLLVVSAQIGDSSLEASNAVTLNDGVLTQRNTFQKYFGQQELQSYIEDALETAAVPVAVGIFYVFRLSGDRQLFLQSRSRRRVDWSSIAWPFKKREKVARGCCDRRPRRIDKFAENQPLLEEFWSTVLSLGRIPLPQEFERCPELSSIFGSTKRALRHLLVGGRLEAFERAKASRKADLLVYLASSNLRKAIPFSQLPGSIRTDITVFYGNYRRALQQGRDLLYSAADVSSVVLACDESVFGWQDARSLYVHTSVVDRLPIVLRTLVACAEVLYGDFHQADLIRIHKYSARVTFLSYDNFEAAPLPALTTRTRVNLRTVQMDIFDHSRDGQLLYFKERFLAPDDGIRSIVLAVSDLLKELGISDSVFLGPNAAELRQILANRKRLDLSGQLGLV
jgi:DNA phosphorothioation-associated putative methyltransferase